MSQTEHPEEKCDYPDPLPPNAENTSGPGAPKYEKIAYHNIENAKQFWRRWVTRPIACIVRWIDKHDGVVTAAATVAIAFLTWSLSQDSRRQANTANDQFNIMKRQLEADQRPWIGAPTIEAIPIGNSSTYKFNIVFKNIGKAPTHGLYVDANIVQDTEVREEWVRQCSNGRSYAREKPIEINMFSIFPGNEFHIPPWGFPSHDRHDLENMDVSYLRKMHKPHIVGCAIYKTWADDSIHQTAFAAPLTISRDNSIKIEYIYSIYPD